MILTNMLSVLLASAILQQTTGAALVERPRLLFHEDWTETPAALPITQEHVVTPGLILSLHGPGKGGVKKSHHDKPPDDPYYVWSGQCNGNWAVSLRHKDFYIDLTGQAKIRWRAKQSGFRQLRLILRLAGGAWIIGDPADGESVDWRVREINLGDLRWRSLDIDKVVEGPWLPEPPLSRVEEVGFTDLMAGGETPASSRLDWIEVWGRAVPRFLTNF